MRRTRPSRSTASSRPSSAGCPSSRRRTSNCSTACAECNLALSFPNTQHSPQRSPHRQRVCPSRCAGALLGTYMRDTGGKSGRRPGRHLQVEASGPGNARPAHWRLAGRFRRGEVAEGCAGGAAGRSKGLICLRGAWMEDTGGKSGRRPGRHLQVEAFGPGNARPAHWRLAGRFRGGEIAPGRT